MSAEENPIESITALDPEHPKLATRADGRFARVSVMLGPDEGHTYKLTDKSVIGRAADAAVRIQDRGVSRRHARFHRMEDNRYVLEDLGSRNGTLVNGHQISRHVLEPGDRIQLGSRCLLLYSVHDDLEESMIQAKGVEIIGRLSAGINHDFNNLLCVILSNAAYLLELPRDTALSNKEVRECLEDMRSAAHSGAELTHRLGTLAQATNIAQESVDLSQLCEETLGILRDTFPKNVKIHGHVQPGIWVRGVRAHLRQLLLNPCLNARDAMPDGGTLSVEAVLKGAEELDTMPLLKAECYAVVTFTDTGRGMTEEVLRAAFEPFFTTKEIELGRGLGLPMVRKVASDIGGTVQLRSQVGRGATLRIVLPVAELDDHIDDEAAMGRSGRPREPVNSIRRTMESMSIGAPVGSVRRRILLAEDDEALGRTLTRALRRAGYEVVWVTDGSRASAAACDPGASFDLVLLDLDVLSGDAPRAHRAIRGQHPEMPVILLSSATEPQENTATAPASMDTVVKKPVDPAVLARVVQLALRRAGRGSRPEGAAP